jgi:hypothetical protein
MAKSYELESEAVQKLARLIEESIRATAESAKYFVEPTSGVLGKAKSKRHHIVFGRRGSGKSSLLHKVTADLTVNRTPIAYVDLEAFKGHSYPDVLLSILLKSFSETKRWLDTAATNPRSKTSFWLRLFGATPTKGAFNKGHTASLSTKFQGMISELEDLLFQADEAKRIESTSARSGTEVAGKASAGLESPVGGARSEIGAISNEEATNQIQSEYSSRKIEALLRRLFA